MQSIMLSMFILLVVAVVPVRANDVPPVWSFVVMGDTRDRVTATATGISPDLPRLATAIAAEKPDLVIHTGDLINGYHTDADSPVHKRFREMFQNWKAAVRPIYNYGAGQGIPIYLVRGNHEDGKLVTDPALKQAYEDAFAALMPRNGPQYEKGLTYSFTHKGARFFALDGYHEKKMVVLRGYVNQQWLDEALARDKRPFTFAFSHTPAFRAGNYHESPFPDFYSHPARRDAFWKSLNQAGALAYFCGHIHLYCRGTVDGVEQVVVGNGGADTVAYDSRLVDERIAMHFPEKYLPSDEVLTGYLVMTVDERAGTATGVQKIWNGRKGVWVRGDVFTLHLPR